MHALNPLTSKDVKKLRPSPFCPEKQDLFEAGKDMDCMMRSSTPECRA